METSDGDGGLFHILQSMNEGLAQQGGKRTTNLEADAFSSKPVGSQQSSVEYCPRITMEVVQERTDSSVVM